MPNQDCRIAVVGVGPLVGVAHCNAIKSLKAQGAELAAVCQRRMDDSIGEKLGVPMYTDVYQMMQEELLDGVVIAAPTHLHLSAVKDCINGAQARRDALGEQELRLKAILVEKPLCEDLHAAVELVELAEKAGVEILAGHQRRHSAYVQRARELVTDANFGPLRSITAQFSILKPDGYFTRNDPKLAWRQQRGKGGPTLINLVHDVDLMRHITGHEITNVFAVMSGAARTNDVEDTGAVTLVMDHGAVGTMVFSDAAPSPWSYEFTTLENKKYPPVPGEGLEDCYQFMGAQKSLGFPSLRRYYYSANTKTPGWDSPLTMDRSEVEQVDPIHAQMAHFVEVCSGEATPICRGRDAMQSLAVINAIQRSAETGMPVQPSDLLEEAMSSKLEKAPIVHDSDTMTCQGYVPKGVHPSPSMTTMYDGSPATELNDESVIVAGGSDSSVSVKA